MPTNNGPNGPYIIAQPPPLPPTPPPIALYVPASVTDTLNAEQRARVAQIELEFAHRVSTVLAKSYNEILAVIRGGESQTE